MLLCWNIDRSQRPTFVQLHEKLSLLSDEADMVFAKGGAEDGDNHSNNPYVYE